MPLQAASSRGPPPSLSISLSRSPSSLVPGGKGLPLALCLRLLTPGCLSRTVANKYIGRIFHTIGDSFAAGHAYRTSSFIPATNVSVCGDIEVFQEYSAQEGSKRHAHVDHMDNRIKQYVQMHRAHVERLADRGGSASPSEVRRASNAGWVGGGGCSAPFPLALFAHRPPPPRGAVHARATGSSSAGALEVA